MEALREACRVIVALGIRYTWRNGTCPADQEPVKGKGRYAEKYQACGDVAEEGQLFAEERWPSGVRPSLGRAKRRVDEYLRRTQAEEKPDQQCHDDCGGRRTTKGIRLRGIATTVAQSNERERRSHDPNQGWAEQG